MAIRPGLAFDDRLAFRPLFRLRQHTKPAGGTGLGRQRTFHRQIALRPSLPRSELLEQYQQNSTLFLGNPSLSPETIATTELAFDYHPSKTLRTALNLYHYEIHDLISGPIASSTTLTEQNTPGQDGYGSEFEWDWKFLPDWNLRGNYAWQFARNEATHTRVSNVPEHHVYSALAWNFLPKWQIQTQINWIGHRLSSPGDSRQLKDYETVDLTLNAKN